MFLFSEDIMMRLLRWITCLLIVLISMIFIIEAYPVSEKIVFQGTMFHEKNDVDSTSIELSNKIIIEYNPIKINDSSSYQAYMDQVNALPILNTYHSRLAPFSTIEVESFTRSILRKLNRLSQHDAIYRIYLIQEPKSSKQPDFYEESEERVLDSYEGGSQQYGVVKIGVFETKSTTIDIYNPIFSHIKNIVIHPSSPIHYNPHDIYHRHATHVTATIVETFGNNPKLELYFANINLGFFQGIEWFISEGVDILNMSFNTSNSNDGTYTAHSRYLDYLSYHHNIIFVTGAGNRGQTTQYVGGTAFNIVTVGALANASSNQFELASYSSYALAGDVINSKPNLTALGYSYNGQWIGTSFASPRVAAVIGQWMSYFPELRSQKATLLSILHTAATTKYLSMPYNNFDKSGLESKIGAGQLDSLYGYHIINQQQYQSIRWVNQNYFYPKEIYRKRVWVNNLDTIRVTVATVIEIRYDQDSSGNIAINDLKIRLINNGNQVLSSVGQSNIEMLVFKVNQTGYYDIVVTLERPLFNLRAFDTMGVSYRVTSKE